MTEPEDTDNLYAGFCTTCSHNIRSFDGLTACPNCGATGVPCATKDQVTITINTHELKLLCLWSENWGNQIEKVDVVFGIAARLKRQLPSGFCLTMADHFAKLKQIGVDYKTDHPSGDLP